MLKLSELDEVSVAPKLIERQRVSACLKLFSHKTYNALLNHTEMGEYKHDLRKVINGGR